MTETMTHTTLSIRPQPVGVFPFPASFLLLPEVSPDGAKEGLKSLLRGDSHGLADGPWRFYALALEGKPEEALAAITGAGPLDSWNRFVLAPDADAYKALQSELPQEMLPLLEAAAYAFGLSEALPLSWQSRWRTECDGFADGGIVAHGEGSDG
jgi:hypothetical protein